MDRVVSSYTPTLTALARTRRPDVSGPARQLAVGVAAAPGQLPLNSVPAEMQVLAAAADSSWVHFACHAALEDPSPDGSGFALHDNVLTVSDLITQAARRYAA